MYKIQLVPERFNSLYTCIKELRYSATYYEPIVYIDMIQSNLFLLKALKGQGLLKLLEYDEEMGKIAVELKYNHEYPYGFPYIRDIFFVRIPSKEKYLSPRQISQRFNILKEHY